LRPPGLVVGIESSDEAGHFARSIESQRRVSGADRQPARELSDHIGTAIGRDHDIEDRHEAFTDSGDLEGR